MDGGAEEDAGVAVVEPQRLRQHWGSSAMATVDSAETPITVNRVARSFCGWAGKVADRATRPTPQIAVAPPVSSPNKPWKPSARAATTDSPIVRATHSSTIASGPQPSATTCSKVMRRPSSATPGAAGCASRTRCRCHGAFGRQEVHRQAEQRREQQHRCAMVLPQEAGCRGDDGAGHDTGEPGAQPLGAGTVKPTGVGCCQPLW